MLSLRPFLLSKNIIEGFLYVRASQLVIVTSGEEAGCFNFAADGFADRNDAVSIEGDVGAIVGSHVHRGRAGDGILVCGEEEKFPAFLFSVETDEIADVFRRVLEGSVFKAVGEDREDDFAWLFFHSLKLEAAANILDGATEGVEEGGGAAREVGGGSELGRFLDGAGNEIDIVSVVELHERQVGVTRHVELIREEMVKCSDGGFFHFAHGAGTVEDVGDFGEVGVHGFELGRFAQSKSRGTAVGSIRSSRKVRGELRAWQ